MEPTNEQQSKQRNLETQTPTASMECLPCEIAFDILSTLPISSLIQIKFVSKSMFDLTLNPLLINMHASRRINHDPCLILHCDFPVTNQIYFIDLSTDKRVKKFSVPPMPEFEVIDSCNGMLCLKGQSPLNELYIYNPFTRNHLKLPGSPLKSNEEQYFGFGFHSLTKQYKVIKIVQDKNSWSALSPSENSKVKMFEGFVFTPGRSITWTSIGKFPYKIIRSFESHVYLNGRLHWVFWPLYYGETNRMQPMSIDLADEQLREVPTPDCEEFKGMHELVVLGGCLAAIFHRVNYVIEIWVMKKNDVKESWNKEFRLVNYVPRAMELEPDVDPSFSISKLYRRRGRRRVLCLLKNGEILMEYKHRVLVSYDPKSETFTDLNFPEMLRWFQAFVHIGSLHWIDTLIDK